MMFCSYFLQLRTNEPINCLSRSDCQYFDLFSNGMHVNDVSCIGGRDCTCIHKHFILSYQTAKLISAFVFAIRIVQFLYYLNPKFQASSHLLWLYSPVCVGPGRKPRRPLFSERGSFISMSVKSHIKLG